MTDSNGNVVATYNYDAFGVLLNSTGSVQNNYLFAGQQFDSVLGQYYDRARYYQPNIGRFTRQDSYDGLLNEPLSLNKYIYVSDNPINAFDPSGYNLLLIKSYGGLGSLVGDRIGEDFTKTGGRDFDNSKGPFLTFTKIKATLSSLNRIPIYTNPRGNPLSFTNSSRPDLIDYNKDVLYEIKPYTQAELGRVQLNKYVSILRYIEPNPLNGIWHQGTALIYTPPREITLPQFPGIEILVDPPNQDGVILYRVYKPLPIAIAFSIEAEIEEAEIAELVTDISSVAASSTLSGAS